MMTCWTWLNLVKASLYFDFSSVSSITTILPGVRKDSKAFEACKIVALIVEFVL
jgi:hypothetical protein